MDKHLAFEETAKVRDIVLEDYRTADVFKDYGINYCCGGNVSLKDVCETSQINIADLNEALEKAVHTVQLPACLQFDEWSMDFLIDFIINVHHSYVKKTLPLLKTQLNSFIDSHKKKYPELLKVKEVFNGLSELLVEHMQKEEENIFPYLKQISHTHRRKETYGSLFVRTLSKPLHKVLESEHTHITAMMKELRKLTGQYKFPDEACANYQVIYHKLQEFDNDLMQHKHLENNVLFPKALQIEKELLQL